MDIQKEIDVLRRKFAWMSEKMQDFDQRLSQLEAMTQTSEQLPFQEKNRKNEREMLAKAPAPLEHSVGPQKVRATPPPLLEKSANTPLIPSMLSEQEKNGRSSDTSTADDTSSASKQLPSFALRAWKSIGPKEDMGWEMALGTYWLPRIGLLVLTIGVVWLLTLAARRFGGPFAPHLRIAGGYAVCAVLLILGKRLEKRFQDYAHLLMSGGFALTYFVTFATHYIPYTRVISSPPLTLGLLAVCIVIWTLVAQWRRSAEIGFSVTILGHFTVLLATLTVGTPSRFAVVGMIGIGIISAFFLVRNGWYFTAISGMLGSYLNYLLWLQQSKPSGEPLDFFVALSVIVLYGFLFAIAEYFCAPSFREKTHAIRLRTFYVSANTGCFLLLSYTLMKAFPFSSDRTWMLYFSTAAVLFNFGMTYWKERQEVALYNVYFLKSVTLLTLGLACYFSGTSLAVSLSLEALALLFSARRTGLLAPRLLACAAALLATITGGWRAYEIAGDTDFVLSAYSWIQLLPSLLLFALSAYYLRNDWAQCSPKTFSWIPQEGLQVLWRWQLITESPKETFEQQIQGGRFFYLYTTLATVLYSVTVMCCFPVGVQTLLFAISAVVITLFAIMMQGALYGWSALCFTTLAVFMTGGANRSSLIATLPFLFLMALFSEKKEGKEQVGLLFHRMKYSPYLLYGAVTWVYAVWVVTGFSNSVQIALLLLGATGTALLSERLHRGALGVCTLACIAISQCVWSEGLSHRWTVQQHLMGILIPLSALMGDRYYRRNNPYVYAIPQALFIILGWFSVLRYAVIVVDSEYWEFVAAASVAAFFMAYGKIFNAYTALGVAMLTSLVATCQLLSSSYQHSFPLPPLMVSYLSLALLWGIWERGINQFRALICAWKPSYAFVLSQVFCCIPVLLILVLMERIPVLAAFYLTISWSLAAVLFMGVSLLTHQKHYRYCALAVFFIALARAFFIDTQTLAPVFRIAGVLVLGAMLLAVAYGYIIARNRKDIK